MNRNAVYFTHVIPIINVKEDEQREWVSPASQAKSAGIPSVSSTTSAAWVCIFNDDWAGCSAEAKAAQLSYIEVGRNIQPVPASAAVAVAHAEFFSSCE